MYADEHDSHFKAKEYAKKNFFHHLQPSPIMHQILIMLLPEIFQFHTWRCAVKIWHSFWSKFERNTLQFHVLIVTSKLHEFENHHINGHIFTET